MENGYRLADGIGLLAGQAEGLGGIPDRADLLAEGNIAQNVVLRKPPSPCAKADTLTKTKAAASAARILFALMA